MSLYILPFDSAFSLFVLFIFVKHWREEKPSGKHTNYA